MIEKLFEEEFLEFIKRTSADDKFWCTGEFVVIDGVDDAKIKEEFFEKALVNFLVANTFGRNVDAGVEFVGIETIEEVGVKAVDVLCYFEGFEDELWVASAKIKGAGGRCVIFG